MSKTITRFDLNAADVITVNLANAAPFTITIPFSALQVPGELQFTSETTAETWTFPNLSAFDASGLVFDPLSVPTPVYFAPGNYTVVWQNM